MKPSLRVETPLWRRLAVGRHPKRTLLRAAALALLAFVVFKFVLLPVRIQGESMVPTYRTGGINLINRVVYLLKEPQRGDVVAVRFSGIHIMLLKRIVGLPGETIAIVNGVVMINGQPLSEPYVRERRDWQLSPRQLGPDDYFVIGDNRGMPQSLHHFGATEARRIVGKVVW